jgi:hypothetical protein
MDLGKMKEIAGSGFFYSRLPDGDMQFARDMGGEPEELDTETFAQTFGSMVESEEARQEAQGILDEINRTRNSNFVLAEMAQQEQEMQQPPEMAQAQGAMGQLMGM